MRLITTMALGVLVAAPLVSLGAPARADNNDWMGRAQQFFNNNQGNDRDAYERGRDDEMRHQQAEQDRYRYRHRNDYDRDWSRADRYQQPGNGYSNNYR